MIAILEGGLDDPAVQTLIALHRAEASASTPADNAHAMDVARLRDPTVSFFAAWESDALLGIAALRHIDVNHAEVKSMRTAPAALRRGVARTLLAHLTAVARARGYRRLSLETGTAAMFAPANALYEKTGFVDCAAFGGYPASAHNRFMTQLLEEPPCPPLS